MYEITLLTALAGAFIVLIISPGPNFLVITQLSFSQSRQQGICAGLGVASGSILWPCWPPPGWDWCFSSCHGCNRRCNCSAVPT